VGLLVGGALAIRIGCRAGLVSTVQLWLGVGTRAVGLVAGVGTLLGPEGTGACLGCLDLQAALASVPLGLRWGLGGQAGLAVIPRRFCVLGLVVWWWCWLVLFVF
jgi:hypothetical protein